MATHSTVWSGLLSAAASSMAVGTCIVPDGSGTWVAATTANRTSYGRTVGVAITASSSTGRSFEYQVAGRVANSITRLGTGTATWVIASATGTLERSASPTASDDIVGYCETTGDLHLCPGVLTSTIVSGGGGGAPDGTVAASPEAVGDGATNDTSALATKLATIPATNGAIILGAKTYLVSGSDPAGSLAVPMGGGIIGQGPATVLKTTSNTAILRMQDTTAGNRAKFSLFRGFKMLGNSTGSGQNGLEVGYLGSDGTSQLRVEGVVAENLGGRGFSFAYGDEIIGPHILGAEAKGCGDGFYAGHAGSMTGCKASACARGLVVASGNVNFTGGQLIENTIGVEVVGGGNDAHSIVSGTHINHCTTAVKVGAITNAMTFADVHIYQGAIEVNGDGANQGIVHFDGGEFDVTTITATDGGIRFTNATFDTAYASGGVVTTSGGSGLGWVEFVNCRSRTGGIPSWILSLIHASYTFGSDADATLTWQQSVAESLRIQSGVTTATRTLTSQWGPDAGRVVRIVNRNAQSVAFKWSSGGAVTIPTNTWALIAGDGSLAIVLEAGTLIDDATAGIDPTSSSFDGLWLPSYSGAPWNGTASAGSSSGRNLVTGGSNPGTGSAVDTYTPADFVAASSNFLQDTTVTAENYITTTAYTVEFLIHPDIAPADTTVYNNPGILTETGGNWGIVYSDAGVSVYHASTLVGQVALPTGAWAHVAVRMGLVAGELDIFVNGVLTDHNTGVAATGSVTGAVMRVGRNFGAVYLDGQIMKLGVSQTAFADATIAGHYAFAQAKYPSMSLP